MDSRSADRPYWMCQLGGWSVYAIASLVFSTLFDSFAWQWVVTALMVFGLGLGLTHLFRLHVRRRRWAQLPLLRLAPRVVLASIGIAIVIVAVLYPMYGILAGSYVPEQYQTGVIVVNLFNWSATILGWSLIYFGVQYLRNFQNAEAEKWRLKLVVRETELEMLRSQLNPHFLFNSLNSMRALILEDPGRAQEAVTQLAALLRYTLHVSGQPTASLESELETVHNYLALESLRLENRLRCSFDIDPDSLGLRVPPMLVQMLIENAIKHGVAKVRSGGEIFLSTRRTEDELRITVSNTGRLETNVDGGVGLANSIERLRLLFGDKATLRLSAEDSQRVTAEVVIPLEPRLVATR